MKESKPTHYLTTQRSIIYQLTSVISSGIGGLASAALKSYTANQELVKSLGGNLNNSNISAVGGLVITSGALTGTVCGLLFLIILFRPGHGETKKSVLVKELVFGLLGLFGLIVSLVATIITATGISTISPSSLPLATRQQIISQLGSLKYNSLSTSSSKETVAFTILSWFSLILLLTSGYYCRKHAKYVLKNGVEEGVEKLPTEIWLEKILEKRKVLRTASRSTAARTYSAGSALVRKQIDLPWLIVSALVFIPTIYHQTSTPASDAHVIHHAAHIEAKHEEEAAAEEEEAVVEPVEEVIIEPVVEDAAPAAPVEVETPVVVEESLEEEAEKALKA